MKVALIQCPAWGRDCPPYTLAYFKALLEKNNHYVSVFDLNNAIYHSGGTGTKKYWDDKDFYSYWENRALLTELIDKSSALIESCVNEIVSSGTKVVGFTTHTTSFIISLEIAERIKKKKSDMIIVFGGPQCSRSQASDFLVRQECVDFVCTGEGDLAFPRLLGELEAGAEHHKGFLYKKRREVIDGGDPEIPSDLDILPYPDYEPFRKDIESGKYREPNRLDIFDSRGCITCCHFCSEWGFWKKYRTMSGKRIFNEISSQMDNFPKVDYFYFNGSLINGDLKVLDEWCGLIIKNKLKIRWAGQAIPRADMSKDLLVKMKESGCSWLGFGIESGSQKVLDKMNKKYDVSSAAKVLKYAHDAGISTQINIMFGLPTETEADFNETLKFLVKARPYIDSVLASQSFCVLDKGTYLHRNPEKFGITGAGHHLFWKSNKGNNTFAERFSRYETFCRQALSLGIPEGSGVLSVKPDKWFLLGEYYRHEKDFSQAAACYKKCMEIESDNSNVRALLEEVIKQQNNPG